MDREDLILGMIIGIFLAIPLYRLLSKPPPITQTRFITTQAAPQIYYENVEEWEIIRNPKTGRTEGVRVKRISKEA